MSRSVRLCTEASECRSCKALILWVTWPRSGKAMPVDAGPGLSSNHDVVLMLSQSQNKLLAEKYDAGRHGGRRRFVSHFITCPQAHQHRREP